MTQPASPVDIRSKIAHCLRLDMLTRQEAAHLIRCIECAPVLAEACEDSRERIRGHRCHAGDTLLDLAEDALGEALAAWREGAKG